MLVIVSITQLSGCFRHGTRPYSSKSSVSKLQSSQSEENVKLPPSSEKQEKKSYLNLKLVPPDLAVNDGACILAFPVELLKKSDSSSHWDGRYNGFLNQLDVFLAEIAQNPPNWSGECDNNRKANGSGKIEVIFNSKRTGKIEGTDRNYPNKYAVSIEGTMKNGAFVGKVSTVIESPGWDGYFYNCFSDVHFMEDGKFFSSLTEAQEFKDPSLKPLRLAEEKRKAKELEKQKELDKREQRQKYERTKNCGHVYTGKVFTATGGVFGWQQKYQVLGFSASQGKATVKSYNGSWTGEANCEDIPE